MNKRIPALLLAIISALPAVARPWTNSKGKTIEADFVSADEQTVRLRIKGKVTDYPLEKLSRADRDWIAAQSAGPAADTHFRLNVWRHPARPGGTTDVSRGIHPTETPHHELRRVATIQPERPRGWERQNPGSRRAPHEPSLTRRRSFAYPTVG